MITTSRSAPAEPADSGSDELVAGSSRLRFRFVPFPHPAPGHHTGAEYLYPNPVVTAAYPGRFEVRSS